MNNEITMDEKINKALNKVRPYLRRDAGDVEFVLFKDGIVYVKMLGACVNCSFKDNTVKDGIEELLIEEVDGVLGVVSIN